MDEIHSPSRGSAPRRSPPPQQQFESELAAAVTKLPLVLRRPFRRARLSDRLLIRSLHLLDGSLRAETWSRIARQLLTSRKQVYEACARWRRGEDQDESLEAEIVAQCERWRLLCETLIDQLREEGAVIARDRRRREVG